MTIGSWLGKPSIEEVTNWLEKHNVHHGKEERKISNAVGAGLRSEFGNDIIARRLGESIEEFLEQERSRKILIDGLRHPDEVTWVKENLRAQVIGITASPRMDIKAWSYS